MENNLKIAVIGDPNKGKSSFTSTFAYNDDIKVSSYSGETRISSCHPLSISGEVVYELYDTPGFDNYEEFLNFYDENKELYKDFRALMSEFIKKNKNNDSFKLDIEIYKILLQKPLVIYIINSSESYNSTYEDELEIISLFNLPSFAIYNQKSNENFKHTWEGIVDKYFLGSYDYNVMDVDIEKKIDLLENIKNDVTDQDIREKLQKATSILKKDFKRRQEDSFEDLVEYFYKIIHYEKSFNSLKSKLPHEKLQNEYINDLKEKESKFYKIVEKEWGFNNLEKEIEELKKAKIDSTEFTKLFGLNKKTIHSIAATLGAGAGATMGLGVDTASFFGSLGSGTVIGGAIGGTVGFLGSLWGTDFINTKTKGFGLKKEIVYGPIKDINWQLALLAKFYLFLESITSRSHANRDEMILKKEIAENIFSDKNRDIAKVIKDDTQENRRKLKEILLEIYMTRNENE